MPTVVCIVGPSGSGKTTLVEALVPELKRRGHRVATIKHSQHAAELDRPGKDSWRHRRAGADAVALSAADAVALIRNVSHPVEAGDVVAWLGNDYDIVLAEGFKTSGYPKIQVGRGSPHQADDFLVEVEEIANCRPARSSRRPKYPASEVIRVADAVEMLLAGAGPQEDKECIGVFSDIGNGVVRGVSEQ